MGYPSTKLDPGMYKLLIGWLRGPHLQKGIMEKWVTDHFQSSIIPIFQFSRPIKAVDKITAQRLTGGSHLFWIKMMMGWRSTIIILVGLTMGSLAGPGDRAVLGLPAPGMWAGQTAYLTPQPPVELAQADKSIETKKEQPVQSEQKNAPTGPVEPKPSNRLKEKPPRDFVPSEKIPADQAVDFPTDI
jgi:hypothetical protein